jgi:hypothetical protein
MSRKLLKERRSKNEREKNERKMRERKKERQREREKSEREENHPRNSDAVIFRSTKWQMAMQKTVQCFEGERNELRRSFLVRERKRERDRE